MARPLPVLAYLVGALLICFVLFSLNGRTSPPVLIRSTPDSASHVVEQYNALKEETRTMRRWLSRLVCSNPSVVLPTGGWCLAPHPTRKTTLPSGVPLAMHHVVADPGLASALARFFDGLRILDMGAGIGQYEAAWQEMGANVNATALDGALNVEEYTQNLVGWADFTHKHLYVINSPFDWVMTLEVGEHIPRSFQDTFLDNVDRNNICGVVMSWAVPGQGGHSHVNELANEDIIALMARRGYEYDLSQSSALRNVSSYSWFKKTLMVFHRRNASPWCRKNVVSES